MPDPSDAGRVSGPTSLPIPPFHDRSEFVGLTGPAGVPYFKRFHNLSASERLGLVYRTGTENPTAPRDNGRAFRGCGRQNVYVPPTRIPPDPEGGV